MGKSRRQFCAIRAGMSIDLLALDGDDGRYDEHHAMVTRRASTALPERRRRLQPCPLLLCTEHVQKRLQASPAYPHTGSGIAARRRPVTSSGPVSSLKVIRRT